MKQLENDPSPWWKHRMMWLVVGGPLVVVVAATVTGVIAVRGADPVLHIDELQSAGGAAPAEQGRNHAGAPAEAAH